MKKGRVIISAPRSGSGKTLLTCAMLKALLESGKTVAAFKCGPDYIDPMFHRQVLGIPSGNLDLFFTGEEETKQLFLQENHGDISVIEGVMGLYDGLGGVKEEASCYHLARTLKAPIILVIDCHGMGRSILAHISGFLSMDREHLIKGVILNRMTKGLYASVKSLIEEELGIKVLGYYPVVKDLELDSRYLGLKLPEEIEGLQEKLTRAAAIFSEGVSLDEILDIAYSAEERDDKEAEKKQEHPESKRGEEKVKIAVAMDEAFCFYYRENLKALQSAGAELVFFSPLRDEKLPKGICGLLLGGGYPELVARELSENVSMRRSVKEAITHNMPSLAECGGFMYLHDSITTREGEQYPMAEVIKGNCFYTGKLVRFGYVTIRQEADPFENFEIKGHEFHYYESENCGEDCTLIKPVGNKKWSGMHVGEEHIWGFAHLYYPSCKGFAREFVNRCRAYQNR